MDNLVELKPPPEDLRDPLLFCGFAVRRRAGRLATGVFSYLVDEWNAELVARITPDHFYDLAVLRPQVRWVEDKSVLDWPETLIYVARPPDSEHDAVFLIGNEPHFHWQTFVDNAMGYLERCGLKVMVTARAFPASVPHTRPAPVCLSSDDPELIKRFGAQLPDWKIEGETDIGVVLSARAESEGWQVYDLSVLQPSYFPRMPNAQARLSLVRAVAHAVGAPVSLGSLNEAAEGQAKAVAEAFAAAEGMPELIRQLEEQYDSGVNRPNVGEVADGGELPATEDIMQEVERLFEQGGGGGSGED
jgi:predicted ATP-grasp superfamily ATP-dependent carboligase